MLRGSQSWQQKRRAAHKVASDTQPAGKVRQKSRVAATWTRPYVRGPLSSSPASPLLCKQTLS